VAADTDPLEGARTALSAAGKQAGEALTDPLIAALKAPASSAQITLRVSGTRHLGEFVMFRRRLMEITGVNELQTREMRLDEATLVIDYNGNQRAFADALLLQAFDGFSINIADVSADGIRIELVK
jgi:hypothetical protein